MSIDVEDPRLAPTEVLIPEARQHQRHRYVRTGVVACISALVVAALTVSLVFFFGESAGGKQQPVPPRAIGARVADPVYFRPVLCTAPVYDPSVKVQAPGPLSCSVASDLTSGNLNVQPLGSASGFSSSNVPPDAALAGVPSTKRSAERAGATALLPALVPPRRGGVRYVLGPAEMTNAYMASAKATQTTYGSWVVDFTLNSKGSALWDEVTQENFHQELGIELNGVVYSAPLIQPTQSSFTSFNGKGEVSGSLTKAEALHLANALRSPSK
ncbi:MAG TPA: hypothetical protein VGG09_07020 [Acidimicrobiales bacterium]|jgi:hypothetical protein